MVRLRFAPSPTGYLHVGGLRTALFAWLYARQQQGRFIFRLEDTDRQRLVEDAEENLIKMLEWAGLDIDEGPLNGGQFGPYRQSERLEIYRNHIDQLLDKGHAYFCFCSSETLEGMRRSQKAMGLPTRYDGRCRHLTPAEVKEKLEAGTEHTIRMKLPEQPERLVMKDLIRGLVSIETDQLDDQVILKADGFPTYHLASVVDDHTMQITHVVRGEEWLPSLPKHLLLYRYFGWEPPQFAHLSLILNPDRSKLSKRDGAVSVEEFKVEGYLPEALLNFIALLGWNTSDEQELFSREELIEKFSFERVGKAGAVFDREKLKWMNQNYIKELAPERLMSLLQPYIDQTPYASQDSQKLRQVCAIVQPSLVLLPDIKHKLGLFFEEKPETNNETVLAGMREEGAKKVYQEFINLLEAETDISEENFKGLMKKVQKATGIKGKDLWHPVRYALTLEEHGPDLPLVAGVFGKEKCLKMVRQALEA